MSAHSTSYVCKFLTLPLVSTKPPTVGMDIPFILESIYYMYACYDVVLHSADTIDSIVELPKLAIPTGPLGPRLGALGSPVHHYDRLAARGFRLLKQKPTDCGDPK